MTARLLLAATAATLMLAAPAGAVPILEGSVKFRFDDRKVALPILGGKLEDEEGTLRLQGRMAIGKGAKRVVLRGIVVEVRPGGAVTAKVGKLRRKVFSLDMSDAKVGPLPAIRINNIRIRSAGILRNRNIRGTMRVYAAPRYLRFAGGRSELTIDQSFRTTLQSEQITIGAHEGATVTEEGAYAFPITTGRMIFGERLSGSIDHSGGITFTKENTPRLRLDDYLVVIREGILRARANDGDRAGVFSTPLPNPTFVGNDAVTFADVPVTLTATGASVLNQTLESDDFTAGMTVGVLTVNAAVD